MGLGDQLMATGMARGARARGRRIAFGDGRRIRWDHNSEVIFRDNPNIARPGMEGRPGIEWVDYFKGHRIYNRHDPARNRWIWNMDFRPVAGEVFLSDPERRAGARLGSGFVLIEPSTAAWKSMAANKDWGRARYQEAASRLRRDGFRVAQFTFDKGGPPLAGVETVRTRDFRDALALLANASLYIGPEGGLHHGAAAMGVPAVVLFGGFIPPQVTGYSDHINLTGGAEACGSLKPCRHCRDALAAISVDEVHSAARTKLSWT